MARRDLTEVEIRDFQGWARDPAIPPQRRDQITRLVGELQELREREAHQRHFAGLEEQY